VDLSFRFYGQLNDFLLDAHRGHVYHLRSIASVKDATEALGVPHP
jgi:hypothetical protein